MAAIASVIERAMREVRASPADWALTISQQCGCGCRSRVVMLTGRQFAREIEVTPDTSEVALGIAVAAVARLLATTQAMAERAQVVHVN